MTKPHSFSEPHPQAIRSCNTVDQRLYDHYRSVFEALLPRVPGMTDQVAAFRSKWKSRDDGPHLRKYPTNCRGNMQDGDQTWVKNHQCGPRR